MSQLRWTLKWNAPAPRWGMMELAPRCCEWLATVGWMECGLLLAKTQLPTLHSLIT